MLAKRIIPVLLCSNGMLVKGKQFKSGRIVGNAQQAAEIYQAREVDELMVLDVTATIRGLDPDYHTIKTLTQNCFMPISAGGGIATAGEMRLMLASGADKVVIGSAATHDEFGYDLIRECSQRFGSQAVTVAIDVLHDVSDWYITRRCGTETIFYSPVAFAKEMEMAGAGEILLTSINNDGMLKGYDIGLIRKVTKNLNIPVVASGGCGTYEHMHRALSAGADAVAAGAMFQWTDNTPKGAAEYLSKKGWEVRL